MATKKSDDPTQPEYWHKVANMTVLELLTAVLSSIKERISRNAVALENSHCRNNPGDHRSDPEVETEEE